MKNRKQYKLEIRGNKHSSNVSYYLVAEDGTDHFIGSSFNMTSEEAAAECKRVNERYFTFDYSEDEVLEWLKTVPLNKLSDAIADQLQINRAVVNMKVNGIYENGSIYYPEIVSDFNLATLFPVIRAAWKEFRIGVFGASISADPKTGELGIHLNVHFLYKHQNGGENGAEIGTFYWSESKGFEYKAAEEHRLERESIWRE